MTKRIKILIDACMTILLLLLFPSAKVSPSLHIFLGYALAAVIVIHLLLNGKWLINSIKNLFSSKLNAKARYMLILVFGLIIAFAVCTYTGIAIYQSDAYSSTPMFKAVMDSSLRSLYALHGVSAAACVVLTVLHVKVHWSYIKSFISGRTQS